MRHSASMSLTYMWCYYIMPLVLRFEDYYESIISDFFSSLQGLIPLLLEALVKIIETPLPVDWGK